MNSQAWLNQACCSCPHKDERGKVMSLLDIISKYSMGFSNLLSSIRLLYRCRRFRRKTMVGFTPGGKTVSTRSGVSRWRDTNESRVRLRIRCSRQTFFSTQKRAESPEAVQTLQHLSTAMLFSQNVKWEQIQETYTWWYDELPLLQFLCNLYWHVCFEKSINMFKRFHGVNL